MIKHMDEIPITYLNKGQAYTLNIVDTRPSASISGPTTYRTFVRISFEDEQQRLRPAACWQLWKEGRGTNESHQRGGKLQAVEFVDPNQSGVGELSMRSPIELEYASFDGFAVRWTPLPNTPADCSVAVRFNFLSTDFSHSKGVKGIPVRLCAKTEVVEDSAMSPTQKPCSEISYCKVKLFRDHGAERKLSNDIAHVKKTIDKLKQQIAHAESGMKDFGKRKRSGSIAKITPNSRPAKVTKHKRSWSVSSSSSPTGRAPVEEDLHLKLAALQDMFTSTRPASILYLKGEDDDDDPDLHPVKLSSETLHEGAKMELVVEPPWEASNALPVASSVVSPTPSSHSAKSALRRDSSFPTSASNPHLLTSLQISTSGWQSMTQTATGDLRRQSLSVASPSESPAKVQRVHKPSDTSLKGWIDALGVDQSYQSPPERQVKPSKSFSLSFSLGFFFLTRICLYMVIYRDVADFVSSTSSRLLLHITAEF